MTKVFRMLKGLTILGGMVLVAAPAAAQQATAAAGAATTPPQAQTIDRYQVGTARPPVVENRPPIDMTLDEAIAIALERNLDLKVARMNPQSVDYQLQAARASFMPQITASYSYSDAQTPSNNSLDGVSSVTTIGQGFNGGMSQTLPWYGGSISANFTNSRSSTNNVTARLNPSYNTQLRLQYNMPLLNGFKMDNTRNQLRTLAVQREVVDIQLLTSIENTKNSVRTAYWALRSSIEQIEIAKRALDIAKRSYDDTLIKVEIGTLAPIETTTFETQVANAEQTYLAAQIGWEIAELNFKRLLVSGREDELVQRTINPTDRPTLSVQSVDIQAAVTKALQERTDLVVSRRNVDVSRLNLEVTQGATKPTLNLSSGYTLTGQGGTSRLAGQIIDGGYWDALKVLGGFDQPAWNVGFNFTYPLGMRAARANYARAVLSLDQSLAQIKAQELNVTTEVVNAGLNVENTYKLYLAAQKSREAAERNADAAQVRFDNGMLTNFEVVQAQNTLTASRLTELSRLISYVNAVAEFDRVQRVGR
jgi:outer membrane protein TolC